MGQESADLKGKDVLDQSLPKHKAGAGLGVTQEDLKEENKTKARSEARKKEEGNSGGEGGTRLDELKGLHWPSPQPRGTEEHEATGPPGLRQVGPRTGPQPWALQGLEHHLATWGVKTTFGGACSFSAYSTEDTPFQ